MASNKGYEKECTNQEDIIDSRQGSLVMGEKSRTTILLDIVRNLLIIAATGFAVLFIWQWNWIVALISLIPVYVVMLNLFGFLTLPLYALTPESRLAREALKGLRKS